MGCVCGKLSRGVKDRRGGQKKRELAKGSSAVGSEREKSFRVKEKSENGDLRVGSFDRKPNGSRRVGDDHYEKVNGKIEAVVPKAMEGELIAAGWPSSLAAVAGEAINGWIPRKADTFEKLDKIGQGTYSSVYKARDLVNDKVVALKRVRFEKMDPESIKFMAREIVILRRLDHPNIIKLEGMIVSRTSCSLYLVFEYMEHDLTGLASLPGIKFSEPQVKCYMRQLLSGLDHCHSRGVLHRDIKGSNLLIDNHGTLKIADFGLANFFDNQQSVPLTSRVVTLWYRPPELLLGASHYGAAVDMWSTGCILGELYVAKPIMPGRTEVEQLHKIFKLCGSPTEDYWRKTKLSYSAVFKPIQPYKRRIGERFKELPPSAVGLLETLLSIDPALRGTAVGALESEFFTTKPFACDPSSLPTYPPSKEIDAKLREEESRRRRNANGSKERQAAPAHDANAKLASSMQRRQSGSNPKSQSDRFNPSNEAATRFPNDPPKASQAVKQTTKDHLENLSDRFSVKNHLDDISETFSHPVPLALGVFGKKYDDISIGPDRADLSDLVASRSVVSGDDRDRCVQQNDAGSNLFESGRASKEANMHDHGYKGNEIHYSGSLLVASSKVDKMLKDRDRHLQEVARRARFEKA
ncbi:probable serine/threonine-protein kinase At1g54610 [Lycium ferocissimum]|uniref:probable serine/threonine-protein kinase At1g54610 n=1 Tax=Lycium ferocissimum TaxID=112874 RepID=UPI002814FDF5|nr:probable serine/threonine-protein kinase At1g54610 [Lycium ferocissimum]XP_059301330.1 probable serine/threonine-protein kinase At1g54610 [Lycium ferocissimum]XP_059301331.1 probable serine/threonine-protein kinase At1g54610 [Lycium ferocissimum]XP_059301332.1 probable serine/threonine-protein kinase At1g54610 [Lycium ferocissimum]